MTDLASKLHFRPFSPADVATCLDIFDANCPDYFAPNERSDYKHFLSSVDQGYQVCEVNERARGAFGVFDSSNQNVRLNWILIDPAMQGKGIGSIIMNRAIEVAMSKHAKLIEIAASQKSAPFFARFGAVPVATVVDGWGKGMDRIDMEMSLSES